MHAGRNAGRADRRGRGFSLRRVRARLKTRWRQYLANREARWGFADPGRPPVLVYRMGKVGSRTVYTSLKAAAIANPVLAVHFLSEDLDGFRKRKEETADLSAVPYHLLLGSAVRTIIRRRPGAPCKIISLVRDPIAFAVSNLFEKPEMAEEDIRTERGEIDPEKALRHLDRKFRRGGGTRYIDNWFDRELNRVFGIDVYATPFPTDRGYAVYQNGCVQALVIRLEDLSAQGPRVLADFLGVEQPVELIRSNSRTDSRDASAYRQVCQRIRLDETTCRKIYACRVAQHFYGEDMIERFILHWTKEDVRIPCNVHEITSACLSPSP